MSDEEKKELRVFSNILQKYGFVYDKNGKIKYIGKFFYCYPEKKAWEELKKNITQKEFLEIRNVFKVFEQRFKKIWKPQELKKRIKTLRDLTNKKRRKLLMRHVRVLFGSSVSTKEIFVIVLLSPLAGKGVTAAGSANIGNRHITYEIPKLKKEGWEQSYSAGILAHEIAHSLFSKKGGEKEITKIIKKEGVPSRVRGFPMSTVSIINEAITESFVPIGYLGQRYVGSDLAPLLLDNSDKGWIERKDKKQRKEIDYWRLRKYLMWQLYPLAVMYGRQHKSIDEYFIKQAVLLLKNAIGK